MTLADILGAAKKHIVAMVITVAVIFGATCGFAAREVPVYTAYSQYYATLRQSAATPDQSGATPAPSQESPDQVKSDQDFVRSQIVLLNTLVQTDAVLQPVIDKLKLSTTPDALAGNVAINSSEDSLFLTIGAKSTDPQTAADIANAVGESLNNQIAADSFGEVKTNALSPIVLQVVKPAKAPGAPTSNNRSTLLIGGLVAVVVAFLVAIALEAMNRRVRDVADLSQYVDAPVLGLVPESNELSEGTVVASHPGSHAAEGIRRLARNLAFVTPDRTTFSNVVVITSPGPSEGKTTIAANVAAAFAENDEKVLLVDTDLRHPSVAKLLGINGRIGLTHLVTGQADSQSAIQPYWKPHFHVLPAGEQTTNPGIIINSQAMMSFLEQAAAAYDHVVLDTAPLSVTNDAAIFSKKGTLTLLVTAQNRTLKRALRDCMQELSVVGVQIVGTVFNRTKLTRGNESYYYYYYYLEDEGRPRKRGLFRRRRSKRRAVKPEAGEQ